MATPLITPGLTLAQVQGMINVLRTAIGDPTLTAHFPDGKSVTYRSMKELIMAIDELEDYMRKQSGAKASKSTLGEHRRGDGPVGPSGPGFQGGWGYW